MKHLLRSPFLAGAIVALLVTACNKRNPGPGDCPQKQEPAQSKVAAPTILVNHAGHIYGKGGASLIVTDFNQTTANFYANTLYLHWRVSGSTGPWTNGTLPSAWSNPTATYALGLSLTPGISIEVIYSTNVGTVISSMGSSSPIYTVPV